MKGPTTHMRPTPASSGSASLWDCASHKAAKSSARFPRIFDTTLPCSSGPTCSAGWRSHVSVTSLDTMSCSPTLGTRSASPGLSGTSWMRGTPASRCNAPGVFVNKMVTRRMTVSSVFTQRGRLVVCPSLKLVSASLAKSWSSLHSNVLSDAESKQDGTTPMIRPMRVKAREATSQLPSSSASSAAWPRTPTSMSENNSPNAPTLSVLCTTSGHRARFVSAPSSRALHFTTSSRLCNRTGRSSAQDSRKAESTGDGQRSCRAPLKLPPSRSRLHRRPALRPQRRGCAGRSVRWTASTMSEQKGSSSRLKASTWSPIRIKFPRMDVASSAALGPAKLVTMRSSAASMSRSPRATFSEAVFAVASQRGGNTFSLVSWVIASRRSLK
mmetsp:Transcript_50726/g.135235  ORF Transcript_50726/g.135235 Transcript_50726/m.135235 type:complete len:384 (+) Transcript_50726:313-1464(+)